MVFQHDLMRFQSSNPPSFWSNNKKNTKSGKGKLMKPTHFPSISPEIFRAKRRSGEGNPSLFGTETSCVGFSCVRVSQWEQTRQVHWVGGWRDFFFLTHGMGQWWVEIPPLTSGNLCVVMLYHGSHPPQIVPKNHQNLWGIWIFVKDTKLDLFWRESKGFHPPGSAKT